MSLRRYFQPRNGLPDAQGSLSREVSPRAIANANKEVSRVIGKATTTSKRGPYRRLVD